MFLVLIGALGGCSGRSIDWSNEGAPAGRGFLTRQFTYNGETRNYTVFVPWSYSDRPQVKYPVIMFLHGVLEGGSDGRKCVTVGLGPAVNERRQTFPFLAVFPQSGSDWQGQEKMGLAMATLDQVLKDYPGADPDRVILTGLSNGGDGTWKIGAAYPNRFAALVPMCSAVDYDDVPNLTKIPIWCFHNAVDPFRSCGRASAMCDKIRAAGGNVRFTKYGTFGHDCWTEAYSTDEVFHWMMAQKRGGAAPTAGSARGGSAGVP
jgi:predicted peptidase